VVKHDYSARSVSLNSPGKKHIGFVMAHRFGGSVRAVAAVVRATSTSPKFVLQMADRNLHASTSVAASNTPEVIPFDRNQYAAGDIVELALNVVASGAGGTADVTVSVEVV